MNTLDFHGGFGVASNLRCRAGEARQAHNLEVTGSNPVTATTTGPGGDQKPSRTQEHHGAPSEKGGGEPDTNRYPDSSSSTA